MSKWNDNIARLKEELEKLIKELEPYWDVMRKREIQEQLISVDKSIKNLQKNNITTPEELRKFKLKLVNELELFKEAEEIKTELHKMFSSFIIQTKTNNKQKKGKKSVSNLKITLYDLIKSGIIKTPLEIEKNYKSKIYKGIVKNDGTIELVIDGQKQIFDSPSMAANAITQSSINGWIWWQVKIDNKIEPLNYYRKRIKNHEA